MIEKILFYERDLFLALNGSESELLDRFMWLYSGKAVWIPLVFLIFFVLVYKKGWKESLFVLIAIALVITLCDQFASGLCKPMFERFRPTHHPDFMNQVETVFGYRGGRWGFMSSHTTNAFGFATFMVLLFRNTLFTWTIYIWAAVTAYSRIYLGVHFISDIVPAVFVGLFFGYIVFKLYKKVRIRVLAKSAEAAEAPCMMYTLYEKRLISYGIFTTVLVLLTFNASLAALILQFD
ncbi:phosphatase PAP2 family protein [Bacteroides sp. 224]|uniref:phosphatase PAP2 family protein n=1 Tax=Bacteroides sp. 224 TaxID=2302936 RepID=UPI0013D17F57|nr:phosphatase PAP2 family protein [Bacteroides sp. 224]NDV65084.1 phosphatase PAP2 family protein [Bacteroides sp. 224]